MNFNFAGRTARSSGSTLAAITEIRNWIEVYFGLSTETTVLITELQCYEEGCPQVETVVAILDQPGHPRRFKIHKPMSEVTRDDISRLSEGCQPDQN